MWDGDSIGLTLGLPNSSWPAKSWIFDWFSWFWFQLDFIRHEAGKSGSLLYGSDYPHHGSSFCIWYFSCLTGCQVLSSCHSQYPGLQPFLIRRPSVLSKADVAPLDSQQSWGRVYDNTETSSSDCFPWTFTGNLQRADCKALPIPQRLSSVHWWSPVCEKHCLDLEWDIVPVN